MPSAIPAVEALRAHQTVDSPIDEVFSTPPSTPSAFATLNSSVPASVIGAINAGIPVVHRRTSKPHAIEVSHATDPDTIPVQENSPVYSPATHHHASSSPLSGRTPRPSNAQAPHPSLLRPTDSTLVTGNDNMPTTYSSSPSAATNSPCFVHSLLDHGASFSNWLGRNNDRPRSPDSGKGSSVSSTDVPHIPHGADLSTTKPLDNLHEKHVHRVPQYDFDSRSSSDDEGNSLTKQLAETAVGVRELSKQLGMCFFWAPNPPIQNICQTGLTNQRRDRSCTRPDKYSKRTDCDQGAG